MAIIDAPKSKFLPFLALSFASIVALSSPLAFSDEPSLAPHVRLQWFDSNGSLVDLKWPTRSTWIWKSSPDGLEDGPDENNESSLPYLQVSIELPSQFKLATPEAQSTGSVDTPTVEVLETQSPNTTKTLELQDSTGALQKFGLMISVTHSQPTILIDETCRKAGLSIQEIIKGSSFLFLSAYCSKTSSGQIVDLTVSDDAEFVSQDAAGSSAHSDSYQWILDSDSDDYSENLKASNRLNTQYSEFKISLKRPEKKEKVATKTKVVEVEKHGKFQSKKPKKNSPKLWAFGVGAGPYGNWINNGTYDINLSLDLIARHKFTPTGIPFELELNLPVFSFAPSLTGPANGNYQLGLRAPLILTSGGDNPLFIVSPGILANEFHFTTLSDSTGLLAGPQLTFGTIGSPRFLASHLSEARLSIAPFFGRGISPFFHSYQASAFFLWEIQCPKNEDPLMALMERQLSFVVRLDFMGLTNLSNQTSNVVGTFFGLQKWF